LMGVRRKRIKPQQPQQLWEELGRLPIHACARKDRPPSGHKIRGLRARWSGACPPD
jgi:hypothetical protein